MKSTKVTGNVTDRPFFLRILENLSGFAVFDHFTKIEEGCFVSDTLCLLHVMGDHGSLISTSPDFSEIEGGRSIEKKALAYNQAKNLGDKATRRETEIQQGRQAIESKRAEEQLSTPTSIPDPVKVLETAYQEQEYGGYQPTLPTSYLTRKELDDRNAEDLRRAAEDDITVFEEVASRYTRDKNQTKTIADLLQSPDDQLKLKMFKYMQELSQDTNDVDPVKVEANLKKMELQNLVKKEAEISKGVKGSKKVQELKKEELLSYNEDVLNLIDSVVSKYCVLTSHDLVNAKIARQLVHLRSVLMSGVPNDVAKYCMPEAYKTSLVMSINARSLQNFLELRTSKHALKEIQGLAKALFEALPEEHKFLFKEYIND